MPTLDWLNRATAFTTAAQVPYRLLETVSSHGSGAHSNNLLIQGDNLEALKALLPFYRGQVKCIFIDPPYNTQSAFEHYDDNLEHSQWLSMMLPRLQLLRELLSEDGSIWVTIDDNEGHYLKVLMDEVFGRRNFVANNDAKTFSVDHNQVLVYSRDPGWLTNKSDADPQARTRCRVIQRIRFLHIATNPGDLVLDSFLGSGTTAAVAHKMGRRWIGIEMGEHAAHALPAAPAKVLDGEQAASAGGGLAGRRRLSLRCAWARRCSTPTAASTPRCALPRWPPSSGSRKPAPPTPARDPATAPAWARTLLRH
jgi:hypothetical protein